MSVNSAFCSVAPSAATKNKSLPSGPSHSAACPGALELPSACLQPASAPAASLLAPVLNPHCQLSQTCRRT
eukprot:5444675-Alexandrium_andersonii.AAC.1